MTKTMVISEKRLATSFLILYPWYCNGTLVRYKYNKTIFFMTPREKGSYNLHSLKQNKIFSLNNRGRVPIYRRVVETVLQRPIPKKLEVHHIDWNHENNNLENLLLVPRKEHQYLHDLLKEAMTDIINCKSYSKFNQYIDEVEVLKQRSCFKYDS